MCHRHAHEVANSIAADNRTQYHVISLIHFAVAGDLLAKWMLAVYLSFYLSYYSVHHSWTSPPHCCAVVDKGFQVEKQEIQKVGHAVTHQLWLALIIQETP